MSGDSISFHPLFALLFGKGAEQEIRKLSPKSLLQTSILGPRPPCSKGPGKGSTL